MIDELAARALMELLPGTRRKRWMLFLMHHPELEDVEFVGMVQLSIKGFGGLGTAHIAQSHTWDLEQETT